MRESAFIEQNLPKWKAYETQLGQKHLDPSTLYDLFIHITDDLSYANTYYPNRSVRIYLNGLAQRIHLRIQQSDHTRLDQFLDFWTTELPLLIYAHRRYFFLSLFLFSGAFLIGMLSASHHPSFYEVVLGADYVEMTESFIADGDPMAVYKQRGAFSMTLGIAANNLYIAFLAFILGFFFAIGTVVVLISNGIMVGAFQYFFIERDLFTESFLTIWTHGTLEIAAIILAGAAGLILGKGVVHAGTYHRLTSAQQAFRKSLKILLGITPIFILAAFIEAYFTRFTETPMFIRLGFILFCLAFIIGYFVLYPLYLHRWGFQLPPSSPLLVSAKDDSIEPMEIPSRSDLLLRSMQSFGHQITLWLGRSAAAAAVYAALMLVFFYAQMDRAFVETHLFSNWMTWVPLNLQAAGAGLLLIPLLMGYTYIAWLAFRQITPLYVSSSGRAKENIRQGLLLTIPILLILGLSLVRQSFIPLLLYLSLPVLLLWAYALFLGVGHTLRAGGHILELTVPALDRLLFLYIALYMMACTPVLLAQSTIFQLMVSWMAWIFPPEGGLLNIAECFFLLWLEQWFRFLFFALLCVSTVHLYFALREITQATALRKSIDLLLQKE